MTLQPSAQGRRRHPPVGTWIMSASPLVAETTSHAGFDWAVLDMEHSPVDMMEWCRCWRCRRPMVPVVRVPWNDPVLVKRVLDAGATTVMFPFVQNADEAARARGGDALPPQGVRGLSAMSRASRFGTVPNYLAANKSMGVIVQLRARRPSGSSRRSPASRRRRPVHRPRGSLRLDGPCRPELAPGGDGSDVAGGAALQGTRQAHRHDRRRPESVAQYRAAGFDFVAVGSDLGLFMQGARSAIAALRTPATSMCTRCRRARAVTEQDRRSIARMTAHASTAHTASNSTPARCAGAAPRPRRLHRRAVAPRRPSCAASSRSSSPRPGPRAATRWCPTRTASATPASAGRATTSDAAQLRRARTRSTAWAGCGPGTRVLQRGGGGAALPPRRRCRLALRLRATQSISTSRRSRCTWRWSSPTSPKSRSRSASAGTRISPSVRAAACIIELAERWDGDATGLPVRSWWHNPASTPASRTWPSTTASTAGTAPRIRDERFRCSSAPRSTAWWSTHRRRDYFCVEPVSHVSNAIHMADPLAHGLRSLAPGEHACLDAARYRGGMSRAERRAAPKTARIPSGIARCPVGRGAS